MKKRYYISNKVIGVYFTSIGQVKKYYKGYSIITEIKLKDINPYWKECTL
tara:strand:+ start:712 stop:861 length:150 start_codon:yes stop_codon:yes gene_type:complete